MMKDILKAALAPIIIGVLSAALTTAVVVTRLEEKIAAMQRDMARHEQVLDKELQRQETTLGDLTRRTDDQERRLTRSESTLESIGAMLTEIRGDVKQILRGDNEPRP